MALLSAIDILAQSLIWLYQLWNGLEGKNNNGKEKEKIVLESRVCCRIDRYFLPWLCNVILLSLNQKTITLLGIVNNSV